MNKATYFKWRAILLGIDQAIKHAVRLMCRRVSRFSLSPFLNWSA